MKVTVLVVDDELDIREAWALSLKLAGYSVLTAASPSAAMQLAEEHSFDVVVLDFVMPGMTGLELLIRIREKLPYIRSVIVSGKLDAATPATEITQNLKASIEADEYLHKPCTNDELIAVLNKLVAADDDSTWKDIAQHAVNAGRPLLKDARASARHLKRPKKK